MGDKLDDACKKLRLYLDKVRKEKPEHKVNRSCADDILNPSSPKDFKSKMGFTLYVSLRAVVNSRKLAFHLVIAQFFS